MQKKQWVLAVCLLFTVMASSAYAETECRNLFTEKITKVVRTIISPGLFEPHVERVAQTRGHGFFVERPKHQDNWAEKIWRHYPRKISDWMIKDDNYVFMPFRPFPGRQIAWVFNFLSGDWAVKRLTKFFVGAPYTLSKYVSIPIMIWSVSGLAYDNFKVANSDPIEIAQSHNGHADYQLAPTDHPLVINPRLEITNDDLRAEIYRNNGGDPKEMQKIFGDYYHSVETELKTEPKELFAHVDKLVGEVGKPELKAKADEATHMFYFRLRLLDELYYFPSVFNEQKKEAIDSHEVEISEFISKIQFNDGFLQTAKEAYLKGQLTDDQFVHFSQEYIYNLYVLEMADVLGQNLVKESFGVTTPLNLADMTISLKANMFTVMKSPSTVRGSL
jgi:hypothetical protein